MSLSREAKEEEFIAAASRQNTVLLIERGGIIIQKLLTIAGFDPSTGAGVTADLAVFAAHGYFGISAITTLTVQSTQGVKASHAVDAILLAETLQFLASDIVPGGIKIGLLGSEANGHVVADFLLQFAGRGIPIVLDPVLRSTSGTELLGAAGIAALREKLLPQVSWVTPNSEELGVLTGMQTGTPAQIEAAARNLAQRYPGLSVVATGGDRQGANDLLLLAGTTHPEWMRGEKIVSNATHGTGCAFASALACGLLRGADGRMAALEAKRYVREAIRLAVPIGQGKGPMNLLWPLHPQVP